MLKVIIKILSLAFVCALISTSLFVGVQSVNTPVAEASYIGNPLTGCNTTTAKMQAYGKDALGARLYTVKMSREFDWCRNLHCEYFRIVPCYYGNAKINSTAFAQPSISTTNLGIGWSLVIDKTWATWKDRIEGGDWGYHSELDTYAQFHVVQCIDVWLVRQCSTRRSYSWKLVVDGSGQSHANFKWGG